MADNTREIGGEVNSPGKPARFGVSCLAAFVVVTHDPPPFFFKKLP